MIYRCLHHPSQSVFWTHTGSRVFDRCPRFGVSSAIPWSVSSRWSGAQKNTLRCLWQSAYGLVRPPHAPCARSGLRRHAHLSRDRSAASALPVLRSREARALGLPGRQSVVHEAVRPLRRPTLRQRRDQGGRQGIAFGLAYGQGTGQAVHARAAGPHWHAGPEGHRHR